MTNGSWLRLALKDVAGGGEIVGVSLSPSAVRRAAVVGCWCGVGDKGGEGLPGARCLTHKLCASLLPLSYPCTCPLTLPNADPGRLDAHAA